MRNGRCLCGACTYAIEGEPIVVAHCCCVDCQRQSGAGHMTGAMFPVSAVTISGEPASYAVTSDAGNTVTRLFCVTCGTPLFGMNTGMPDYMTACVGTLDEPDTVTPEAAIFARTRRHWDLIDPGLPTYDGQPDWKPTDGI